ncbi:unnamed protein product [Closterium sp. Naga37s-1]|nr:unnamed protein product [Closterium sp. Naga37s-1]
MDWRTFRAKLVAGHEATRSVSAPSPAQEAVGLEIWQVRNSGAGVVLFRGLSKWFEIWQDRMSLENWALLASQNPRLAKEVPWVHSTGGAEAGGVLLAAPFSQLPGQGGAEGGDGGRGGGAGALDRRLWQAAVFLVEHGGASGASWGLLLNRPSGYTIQMVSELVGNVRGLDRRLWQAAVFLVEHGGVGWESWGLLLNRPSGYTIQMVSAFGVRARRAFGMCEGSDAKVNRVEDAALVAFSHLLVCPLSLPLSPSPFPLPPSAFLLNQALAKVNRVEEASLAVFARNAIYIGGFKSDGSTLYFLHGHDLPGAKELMPGVYMGGLEAAAEQVLLGNMPPSDFRFFVGQVEWPAGKLQEEVDAGLWYTAACARSLVLKQCLQLPKPLWREMLELMGGEYAETARKEYGQSI